MLPLGTRIDRRRVRAAARRFAAAYARYELGHTEAAVALELRRSTTHALAAELLHNPPRLAVSAPLRPTRTWRILGVRVQGASAWAMLDRRRGQHHSGLSLTLERAPGRFLVTRIG